MPNYRNDDHSSASAKPRSDNVRMERRAKLKRALLQTPIGAWVYLIYKWGLGKTHTRPDIMPENAVLKTTAEWLDAERKAKLLGLPPFTDRPKNWDSLAALSCILEKTSKDAHILDAGAEVYSVILPWLYRYGYKNLTGINLVFDKTIKIGPIVYEYGDLTRTRFGDNSFDAITCLSVIEHGVDLSEYFREMSRLLKPNGVLITSTDYYETPVDTHGQYAYGVPIQIFSRPEIEGAIKLAKTFSLEPTGPIDLTSKDKTVRWEDYDLDYTFALFTLKKRA